MREMLCEIKIYYCTSVACVLTVSAAGPYSLVRIFILWLSVSTLCSCFLALSQIQASHLIISITVRHDMHDSLFFFFIPAVFLYWIFPLFHSLTSNIKYVILRGSSLLKYQVIYKNKAIKPPPKVWLTRIH